jgi:hypothetical protein
LRLTWRAIARERYPLFDFETYKHSISTSGSIYSAGDANRQSSVTEVEEDSRPPKEFIGFAFGFTPEFNGR